MEETFDFQKAIARSIFMRKKQIEEQRQKNINTMIGYIYELINGLFDRAKDLITNGEIEFHGKISYNESYLQLVESGHLSESFDSNVSADGLFEDFNHVIPKVLERLNSNYRSYVSIVTGKYDWCEGVVTSDIIFKIDIESRPKTAPTNAPTAVRESESKEMNEGATKSEGNRTVDCETTESHEYSHEYLDMLDGIDEEEDEFGESYLFYEFERNYDNDNDNDDDEPPNFV